MYTCKCASFVSQFPYQLIAKRKAVVTMEDLHDVSNEVTCSSFFIVSESQSWSWRQNIRPKRWYTVRRALSNGLHDTFVTCLTYVNGSVWRMWSVNNDKCCMWLHISHSKCVSLVVQMLISAAYLNCSFFAVGRYILVWPKVLFHRTILRWSNERGEMGEEWDKW